MANEKTSKSTIVHTEPKLNFRGGVSTTPGKPATVGIILHPSEAAPAMGSGAYPNFSYHGGPIIKCPQVISSFWGPHWWDAAHAARASRLNQFIRDLLASKYMNILTQYGVGLGAGVSGAFIKATFVANVPTTLTETSIHNTIQASINSHVLPEPTDNSALIIYLDEGVAVNSPDIGVVMCAANGDDAFGYHSSFVTSAGHRCYYSIIPALDNHCLQESCAQDGYCSLHLSQTQEQRQTQVTSHEFAEMVTDPQGNAWYDGSSGAENGDICNGQSGTITVGSNTWTVQRMYSKVDDLNGTGDCITEPTNPIPKINPGPASATETQGTIASYERLLPLPTMHFDAKTHKANLDAAEVEHYIRKLFWPLQVEHVTSDLPALLREVADILSKKPR